MARVASGVPFAATPAEPAVAPRGLALGSGRCRCLGTRRPPASATPCARPQRRHLWGSRVDSPVASAWRRPCFGDGWHAAGTSLPPSSPPLRLRRRLRAHRSTEPAGSSTSNLGAPGGEGPRRGRPDDAGSGRAPWSPPSARAHQQRPLRSCCRASHPAGLDAYSGSPLPGAHRCGLRILHAARDVLAAGQYAFANAHSRVHVRRGVRARRLRRAARRSRLTLRARYLWA